ncbi:Protein YIP4 [Neolecta irregularis DAH-3]|uniref:Protein YIP n=1 Tax=Neolecta irregularis (strain DAH-3) TaxID=1198029 RepID=A0A1U7LSQ8_NEOID|nr:Protein YIP4 [Neolecta irregularis DAH-3]|eukprot:OLL25705.1 Protein YIP4 [Neolecta irregularis DAH-3]
MTSSISNDVLIEADDDDLELLHGPEALTSPSPSPATLLTENRATNRRFTGGDTLDEPVTTTIVRSIYYVELNKTEKRDAFAVAHKLRQVLYPLPSSTEQALRDWDLWGPLIFCLFLSLCLSFSAPKNQSVLVFTGIFSLVWFGEAIVTMNIKVLGGKVSMFQSVSILGYALAPLVVASLIGIFVKTWVVMLPLSLGMYAWSIYGSRIVVTSSGMDRKIGLAMYPLFLFYGVLSYIIILS